MNTKAAANEISALFYTTDCAFRALRGVSFLLSQTEGKGPFEWSGQPIEDLEAMLSLIANTGCQASDKGLELASNLDFFSKKSA